MMGFRVYSIPKTIKNPIAAASKTTTIKVYSNSLEISMNIGKKSRSLAAAAALTLIAGTAHAQLARESFTLALNGANATGGCVRFFVNGQKDVPAGQTVSLGRVRSDTAFMASVFQKTCGGQAVKNVWLTTASRSADLKNGQQTWTVK